MTRFDVVVAGGRVAGAATALLLARAGVRVALVERGRYGSDTLSTHGLMRAGVLQLSRWGVLGRLLAAGTPPIRHTTFHYADGETVRLSIRQSPGVDALYAPRRHLLDRILVDAAAASGAEVMHQTTVTDLLRDGSRVVGVRARDPRGRALELHAWMTVGADGIRSTVATRAGARPSRQGRAAGSLLYRYYQTLPATGYEWAYGAGAAAGLIPTNDQLTCVFVGASPRRMRALRAAGAEDAFAALLRESSAALPGRVADAAPAGRLHGWAGQPGHLRQGWGPGWALVGDAGYFKDPITTHGMTDAMRDAELLADALLDALAGTAPERMALDRYQAVRDRLSQPLFAATEAVAGFDWDAQTVRPLLRTVSSSMGDEVDLLEALPAGPVEGDPRSRHAVGGAAPVS
jgi:flavin-dependent dehydrogenase